MKSDLPLLGVACCPTCKAELELTCPNGHDPEPIEFNAPARAERNGDSARRKAGSVQHTEPSAQRNDENAERSPTKRAFADKTCECGAVFTPTGPNAKRCPRCRGFEG